MMKKKLFIVLVGLFLSVGLGHSSCRYFTDCGAAFIGVCPEYFGDMSIQSNYNEWWRWAQEMVAEYCCEEEEQEEAGDEVYYDTAEEEID